MERSVGMISRRIKSKSDPGANAGNEMLRIAACRDYQRIKPATMQSTVQNADDSSFYQIDASNNEQQIWNVLNICPTVDTYSNWSLKLHLRKYWKRYLVSIGEVSPKSKKLPEINQDIIVGTQFHNCGNVFDSKLHSQRNKKKPADFVQLWISYDIDAKRSWTKPDHRTGTFFGEVLMFFAHKFRGTYVGVL